MLNLTKEYKTKAGKRVIGLTYKPFNDCGDKVTYPIKGSIVEKENPLKLQYAIWSEEGIFDVVWNKCDHLNLIEVNNETILH